MSTLAHLLGDSDSGKKIFWWERRPARGRDLVRQYGWGDGPFLLLNQAFEDADIFVLQNFDSKHPLGIVTVNKAIEWKKLGRIKSYDRLDLCWRD